MEISSLSPETAKLTRFLALDFGSKTIGLAVSDELGITAQGLPTLRRTNKRNDLDHLRRIYQAVRSQRAGNGAPSAHER